MPLNVEIIKPTLDDIPKLLPLWEEQYRLHGDLDNIYYVQWSDALKQKIENYLTTAIQTEQPLILAARHQDDFVGFITYELGTETYFDTKFTKFGSVIEIVVSKQYRGQGIGKKLIKTVETDYFIPKGINDIRLMCSQNNPAAQEFYKRLGFQSRQSVFYKSSNIGG